GGRHGEPLRQIQTQGRRVSARDARLRAELDLDMRYLKLLELAGDPAALRAALYVARVEREARFRREIREGRPKPERYSNATLAQRLADLLRQRPELAAASDSHIALCLRRRCPDLCGVKPDTLRKRIGTLKAAAKKLARSPNLPTPRAGVATQAGTAAEVET